MKFKPLLLLACSLTLGGCNSVNYDDFILGLGGESVPVGQYSSKILKYYDINEEAMKQKNIVTYGKDVIEVASFVKNQSVSAGIVYKSDAYTYELKVVDSATKEMCGQVLYPAARIVNSNSELVKQAADSFLKYLTTDDAMAEFKKVGFVPAHDKIDVPTQVDAPVTVKVFAAASLKASLTAVINAYKTSHQNVTILASFEGSGALQAKIEKGADECDIFISAAQKQMNALATKNLVVTESRFDILENQVVLCVPDKNPYKISSFEQLSNVLKDLLKEEKTAQ